MARREVKVPNAMKRQYRPVFGLEGAERGADDGDAGGADSSRVYVCAMIA